MPGVAVGMETAITTKDHLHTLHDMPRMATFSEWAYNTFNKNINENKHNCVLSNSSLSNALTETNTHTPWTAPSSMSPFMCVESNSGVADQGAAAARPGTRVVEWLCAELPDCSSMLES